MQTRYQRISGTKHELNTAVSIFIRQTCSVKEVTAVLTRVNSVSVE